MATVSIRIDENLKKAAMKCASIKGLSLNQIIIESLKEKLENEEDYSLTMLTYETLDRNNLEDFDMVCEECGIDYRSL